MEKQTFIIPNISCGHCVMSIKSELNELDGVKSVEGDQLSCRVVCIPSWWTDGQCAKE